MGLEDFEIKEELTEEYPESTDTEIKDKKEKSFEKLQAELKEIPESYESGFLFPYEKIRDSQKELIEDIAQALHDKKHILAHAPTGLGKTIAAMGPALKYCIENNKTLFFLTSRHTQHIMGIKTLRDIKDKYGLSINVLDLIGKKSMCLQQGIENLSNGDFSEYCRHSKKNRTCEYFNNSRQKDGRLKIEGELVVDELKYSIFHTEELIKRCENSRVCPYEIAMAKSETANVIIGDYYYAFHPKVRDALFRKIGLTLKDCVFIVDEAHNLPDRIKDLASSVLTKFMLDRSITETLKHDLEEASIYLKQILSGFLKLKEGQFQEMGSEKARLVPKTEFNSILEEIGDFEHIVGILEDAAEFIREKQKRTYVGGVANFLINWQGSENGFTRIFKEADKGDVLMYECLDPSIVSKDVFNESGGTIVVSGTLEPTEMYQDLLGIKNAVLKDYKNPFPAENALNLIVPITTTKYDRRTAEEFEKIAKECGKIINETAGNCAIFFPSYFIRDKIYRYLQDLSDKEFILETSGARKEAKSEIIKSFTRSSLNAKVLLGSSSGSFGEGIDLPGHFLTCVIVVGLPLKKPSLEVQQLIAYYDSKFKKGWDYGYFYPSFNTTFQNIGRCIRSETDKGVIIYLDERYGQSKYLKYFRNRPYQISYAYIDKIREFVKKNKI